MNLTAKEKLAYGLGAVGKDMVYMLSASYILYYYQDVLGVSAVAMGIILLIARVFDAFNDPIMGVLVAKTKTRWGKFRPWLFIGTLLNAVVLYFMFAAPPSLDGGGLVAYAAFTYILWGVTYTMMDIPFWSMIPAFTKGGKERESMSALGRTCAGVGSAIVTIVTVMAVAAIGGAASGRSIDHTVTLKDVSVTAAQLDDAGNTTGKVTELKGTHSITVSANSDELGKPTAYTQSNTKYTLKIGSSEFTQDDSSITLAIDKEDGEAVMLIYLSADEYEKIDANTSVTADITSKREVERLGFKYFALIIAILFFLFTVITCVGIKEKSTVNMQTAGIGDMFKALVQNDQAMTMVITIVLVNTATYITSNLLIYFFKYDLGGTGWQGNYTLFNTFAGGIQILAMMAFFPLLRKFFSAIKVFYICIMSAIGGYVILFALAFTGTNTVYPFLIPGFFIMAAVGILNVLVTIFLANTVDYGELKNGRRDESVIFSMQTFVVKLASGFAALVASICLSVFAISDSATLEAVDGSMVAGLNKVISDIIASGATVVSGNSVIGLRFVMTFVPIIGLIIAILIFSKKYILTEEKVNEITEKLHHTSSAE